MIPARLWHKAKDGDKVHCELCSQFCVIADGDRGLCGVRENHGGELFTLSYERVAALNLDPVEKKPLYHFLPGTTTFSFGTPGCNLSCGFCQNYSLSQPPRESGDVRGERLSPQDIVAAANRSGAASISYTYSEPTIFFELMQDVARMAHEWDLKNIMVSNGFMTRACLDELAGLIDAANVDLKAMTERFYKEICGARLKPVLENIKTIKAMGWWLEITTLVIPGENDDPGELRELAGFIANELSLDTPWHLSRFHPDYKMPDHPPTPVETLEMAAGIGREAGLKYVYVGNVPGHRHNATTCPGCGAVCIERTGFRLGEVRLREGPQGEGCCAACGEAIAGVGMPGMD